MNGEANEDRSRFADFLLSSLLIALDRIDWYVQSGRSNRVPDELLVQLESAYGCWKGYEASAPAERPSRHSAVFMGERVEAARRDVHLRMRIEALRSRSCRLLCAFSASSSV